MELGLYTFADVGTDPATGRRIDPAERLRNLVEEIVLADQLGLDVFGLGEHHRPDYASSAPPWRSPAPPPAPSRIRLTSAVTVLSSDDPVRVFQQFATLDALSAGRAEIMVGRGSFIESFPLFGYDLDDYDALFDEKLRLLLALNDGERLDWPGGALHPGRSTAAASIRARSRPALPIWIAVGGTPQSVVRAGILGLPLALAIIGGEPARFAPLFDLYRRAAAQAGHDPAALATSINVHGFVAETSQAGRRHLLPGPGRGHGPHRPRARLAADEPRPFEAARGPRGAIFAGSPAEVDRQDPRRPRDLRLRPLPDPDGDRRPRPRAPSCARSSFSAPRSPPRSARRRRPRSAGPDRHFARPDRLQNGNNGLACSCPAWESPRDDSGKRAARAAAAAVRGQRRRGAAADRAQRRGVARRAASPSPGLLATLSLYPAVAGGGVVRHEIAWLPTFGLSLTHPRRRLRLAVPGADLPRSACSSCSTRATTCRRRTRRRASSPASSPSWGRWAASCSRAT